MFHQSIAPIDAMQPSGAWRYVGFTVGSQFHPGYYFFQDIHIPNVQQIHTPNRESTTNRTIPVSVPETRSSKSDHIDSISNSQAAYGYRPWLPQDSNYGGYELTGKRLRDMAWEETARRNAAFINSRWAYDLGNKIEAKRVRIITFAFLIVCASSNIFLFKLSSASRANYTTTIVRCTTPPLPLRYSQVVTTDTLREKGYHGVTCVAFSLRRPGIMQAPT